jgi:enoyl-CoA hydratase/carnithine racemase
MTDSVLTERHDDVLLVTLNRPERLNALTREMEQRYFQVLADADADPEVRAVVVTGAGRAFCVGADFAQLDQLINAPGGYPVREIPFTAPLTLRKPLIGAVNGPCAGIGFVQMLYCDVILVADDAKLTTAFSRRGLVAEQGVAWLLHRAVGPYRAADLLLSGRVVTGAEAVDLGLCNRCLPAAEVLPAAMAYAADLAAACDPRAMAVIKEQLRAAGNEDLAASVSRSEDLLREALTRPGFAEGVRSFQERRAPRFEPLT